MAGKHGTETDFELATIQRLEALGYQHLLGPEITRPHEEVVLLGLLRASLARRYPDLPEAARDQAVTRIVRPQGVDTLRRNLAFHETLTRGFELKVELPDGRVEMRHLYAIDWERPLANDFHVVNQLPVHGQNDRRPDIVVYVNGLPLVVFELKNPYAKDPTIAEALNQIQHYRYEIPQLFDYSAFTVASDGIATEHGMFTASTEWFAPWKSIDGFNVEPGATATMKTLIEGFFPPERLLSYVRDFIVFEVANEKITKKGARYHQFFAARLAAQRTVDAFTQGGDKRIGVIWHTTGSGKSLSMTFLVGILRRRPELQNPTFVIQVDRTDLDDQLYDQFVAARSLVGEVKHARSTEDLRDLLRTQGGEVIFTTIEKFRLRDELGEVEHPVLSERSNIIVIADEAHRSQYGFAEGHARYLAEALPNAKRIGFTGTPISFAGADTIDVFGDLIHTYDIRQSQEDRATVPIYYAPRQIRLHLTHDDVDAALQEIIDGEPLEDVDRRKSRWAALAAAAGATERVAQLAEDLLSHFLDRTDTLAGKAMVVCMTRENCVRLYDALTALPGCPEVKIVMTSDLGKDPPEWARAGHATTKAQRDAIKKRMVDPDDSLKMVIVCDMWLTGTDIPCLHTLYVDKPMQGHNMIQAISRVNRVFRDKPAGLIVDYIGIGDQLREATGRYTQSGGRGDPAPDVGETARPLFVNGLAEVRALLPTGHDYGGWRRLTPVQREDLFALVYAALTDDDARDRFLQAELRLTALFLLVKHLEDCRVYAEEILFFQQARNQLTKLERKGRQQVAVERAVRDLVDQSLESEGVTDIFHAAGLARADISILDDDFVQTFKNHPFEDLRLKLLEQLLHDELTRRQSQNLARTRSFRELLEETLRKYHNRLIDAAAVVQAMLQIKQDLDAETQRAAQLKLAPEELAFYDAVADSYATLYDEAFLCDLIREVVATVKQNLKVDWTEPHRDDVKAAVRSAVRRTLRRRGVRADDLDPFVERVLTQAEALFANWPIAA